MIRSAWFALGVTAVAIGAVGVAVPLLPTVPFLILAAYCFARSSTSLERWLVEHRRFGPHIRAWRTRGAIGRPAKRSAMVALAASSLAGFLLLPLPWALLPLVAAAVAASWILSRPE